jgi:SRSO17 transposase
VRAAHRDWKRNEVREEEWLMIDWLESEAEPVHYWLCNLPATMALRTRVNTAMMRWRIERDYQELKQEFGLSHYEGRGWRGFHHHATLCIAAYGFLTRLAYPKVTRRAAAGRVQRHVPDSIATLRYLLARGITQQLDRCPCCAALRSTHHL